jgi:hypothetical protein
MKKTVFTLLSVGFLFSCRQDFVCECKQITSENGGVADTINYTVEVSNVTKQTIMNDPSCVSFKENGTYTNGITWKKEVECTILPNE